MLLGPSWKVFSEFFWRVTQYVSNFVDVYVAGTLPDASLLGAPSRRGWIRQLFPCWMRQSGGGGPELAPSSDEGDASDETRSLKEVERTLMQEENAAKDRYMTTGNNVKMNFVI